MVEIPLPGYVFVENMTGRGRTFNRASDIWRLNLTTAKKPEQQL